MYVHVFIRYKYILPLKKSNIFHKIYYYKEIKMNSFSDTKHINYLYDEQILHVTCT